MEEVERKNKKERATDPARSRNEHTIVASVAPLKEKRENTRSAESQRRRRGTAAAAAATAAAVAAAAEEEKGGRG